MRIAITADPLIPIPPQNYGGIERIIDFLVIGLIKYGHDVVLVAHPDSKVDATLIKYKNNDFGIYGHVKNIITIGKLKAFKPDVIHSFSRLVYLLPFLPSSIPKVMSYQREPTLSQIKKALRLTNHNSLTFTGCSNYISNQIKTFGTAYTIYNGVDISIYNATENFNSDNPLVFLGRIEPIKGTHIAIEVAKKTHRKLIIAGNIPIEYQTYFNDFIRPHLNDKIKYVGVVNDIQKNELLGNASALLMPIDWNEPFGIVMIEAMACGTPVIALNKGSVPEVIIDGVNGFICNSIEQMVESVYNLKKLNRKVVRQDCENRFSSDVIVEEYLKLYNQLTNQKNY